MWAKMAKAAQDLTAAGDERADFLAAKLVTARFYMDKIMPETQLRKVRIEAGSDTLMELAADAF
jgi:acyl-CoA dehydrogenase